MPLYYPDISWSCHSCTAWTASPWSFGGLGATCEPVGWLWASLGPGNMRKPSETTCKIWSIAQYKSIYLGLNLSPSLLPLGSAAFEASCPYSMGLGNDHTSTCWPCWPCWTGDGVRKMNDWTPVVPALVIKHCFFGHYGIAVLLLPRFWCCQPLGQPWLILAHCNKHEAWRCDWASEFSRPEGQELTSLFSLGASQSFYILNQIWIKSYWVAAYLDAQVSAQQLRYRSHENSQQQIPAKRSWSMSPWWSWNHFRASSCCKTSTIWSQSCSGFQTVLGESNSEVGECCTSEFRNIQNLVAACCSTQHLKLEMCVGPGSTARVLTIPF